jgi:hypothetical protein
MKRRSCGWLLWGSVPGPVCYVKIRKDKELIGGGNSIRKGLPHRHPTLSDPPTALVVMPPSTLLHCIQDL